VLLGILTEQLFSAKGWCVIAVTRNDAQHMIVQLEPTRASAICSGCGEPRSASTTPSPLASGGISTAGTR
jgi:hypothetical protein